MVISCFSNAPLMDNELDVGRYGEVYGAFANDSDKFQIKLCQGPCKEPACWCRTMICCLPSQMIMRKRVLNHINPGSGLKDYECCQGVYMDSAGTLGESTCPVPCLCLEVCLCAGPAASATSITLREEYKLGLDEDDVRLIRLNNCIFCASAVLRCLTICIPIPCFDFADACARTTSDVLFCCTVGCILSQVHNELKFRNGPQAPMGYASMER